MIRAIGVLGFENTRGLQVQNLKNVSQVVAGSKIPSLSCDTVSFGNSAVPEIGKTTNYTVYDKEQGKSVPLVIKPGIDFTKFEKEEGFFPGLNVSVADFSGGNLSGVYLKGSNLYCSNFNSADLRGARMHESNLFGCIFSDVQAAKAKFYKSNMCTAELCGGDFTRANMQNTDFSVVDDEDYDEKGYTISSNFKDATLVQVNFLDADLSGALNTDTACFLGAIYNKNTKFPKGFDPVKKGMLKFESNADLHGMYLSGARVKTGSPLSYNDYSGMNFKEATLDKAMFFQLDLSESVFDDAHCKKIIFDKCLLNDTSFKNCDLRRANFQMCSLKNAKFEGEKTNLESANFIDADLSGTDIDKLDYGQLRNALFSPKTRLPQGFSTDNAIARGMIFVGEDFDFSDRNLSGTKFSKYKFSKYDIRNFKGAKFTRADLHYTDFDNTILVDCVFNKASLKNASLKKANCENASFLLTSLVGTDVSGANFKGANLKGAKMRGLIYDDKTNFANAVYDQNTLLPEGFDPKEHKMIYQKSTSGLI